MNTSVRVTNCFRHSCGAISGANDTINMVKVGVCLTKSSAVGFKVIVAQKRRPCVEVTSDDNSLTETLKMCYSVFPFSLRV